MPLREGARRSRATIARRIDRSTRGVGDQLLGSGHVDRMGALPEDPADRFIAATALVEQAELVTADERILAWQHAMARHDART